MLLLLTGQPGHGKTTLGLVRAKKLKDEGRTVYAHGVRGLKYDDIGFHRLDDPSKWEDLPDGSVVLIDECYTTFPSRAPGKPVPPHVEAMARHRHRGFDFILICQQGLQLDNFLRGLVEEHIHCKRKWGTRATKLKRWGQYQSNVNAVCSDVDDWMRPGWVYAHFESTTMDTSKVHVPKWMKLVALLLAFVIGLVWFLKHRVEAKVQTMNAEAAAAADTRGTSGAAAGAVRRNIAGAEDYLAMMQPRVESIPSSAPLYDGRPVKQVPTAYCVLSGAGADAQGVYREAGCTCYTQQMTRVRMHPDACRAMAVERGAFDPFADPPQEPREAGGGVGGAPPTVEAGAMPAAVPSAGTGTVEQVASYGGFRS